MTTAKTAAARTFGERVIAIVQKIPKGSVLTYAEVARRAGSPNGSRAVGSILKRNYRADIPCHRVIRSDGKLGQYNRGDSEKRRLLAAEGYLSE